MGALRKTECGVWGGKKLARVPHYAMAQNGTSLARLPLVSTCRDMIAQKKIVASHLIKRLLKHPLQRPRVDNSSFHFVGQFL